MDSAYDYIESLKKDVNDLQVRYCQLEYIAKMMLSDFKKSEKLVFDGHTDLAIDAIKESCSFYPSKLSVLGVSLHD